VKEGEMEEIQGRLRGLEVELARAFHPPKGNYQNAMTLGNVVYVSGHGPLLDGKPAFIGRVPSEVDIQDAYKAARLTAINCLATLEDHLRGLNRLKGLVRVFGMVNADPDFTDHPSVIDGASDLFKEVLGDRGWHTRSAVGMHSLPFGIPVEIELVGYI
jgi:enamine deaminase RidA (YjgF/YER057c/UK114 family)